MLRRSSVQGGPYHQITAAPRVGLKLHGEENRMSIVEIFGDSERGA